MSSLRFSTALVLSTLVAIHGVQAGPVIKEGDTWKYFKGRTSDPPDQGAAWTQAGYNDATNWLGPSPSGFGFGDSDDATVLGDMQYNYVSVFIRRAFVIANTSTVTHLTLAADYDDGFVAYINGTEVARRVMPAGTVTYATAAAGNHEASKAGQDNYTCNCDPQEKEFITLDPGLLVNGTNVLAVSGHNISLDSTDLSLIMELYTNITLLRGPMLQMPNPGRVTVTWRTDALTDSIVDCGYDTNYAEVSVANGTPVRDHVIELPAFPPGTTVYYRIRSGGLELANSQFRAPVASTQSFRLAIMSDFGSPTTNTTAVAHQVELSNADLLLTAGDNVQQNSAPPGLFDSDWFGPLAPILARMPMMATIGNHDIRVARGDWYVRAVTLPTNGPANPGGLLERNYSYDYGNAHIVHLDANAFVPDADSTYTNAAAQRAAIVLWLTNDLASTTQPWKFAIYHQPPYTSLGSHDDEPLMKSMLGPIFERYGLQICFQGHNHMYERINPINGVIYVTVGSGGFSIHGLSTRKEYSSNVFNDKYDFVQVDIDGPHLVLRCIDQNGVQRDIYDRNLDHPFDMDGRRDSTAWVRASNTLNTIKLHAAIRGNYLYLAGQDAPPPANGNNDHFIYVNTNLTGQGTPANWGKNGSNMQWSAFLGDESINGFVGWFGAAGQALADPVIYRATSSGLFENGTNKNGALEGTLNLPAHLGSFPPELCLAFAPYATADGGTLLWEYQIPPGTIGNSINSNEWLRVSTRSIALDLPVANAGTNQAAEAGLVVALDGTGSSAPSGLPLSFAWDQLAGPGGALSNAGQALASIVLTNQPAVATSVVMRLRVHDTRFDETGTVTLAFTPWVDSDGDGLSEAEETAGLNNILTLFDPAGRTSSPSLFDTDSDGVGDGAEAFAGTDPNSASSFLRLVNESAAPGGLEIHWSSASGRHYAVHASTNLLAGAEVIETNIPATPSLNVFTVPVDRAQGAFFIGVEKASE